MKLIIKTVSVPYAIGGEWYFLYIDATHTERERYTMGGQWEEGRETQEMREGITVGSKKESKIGNKSLEETWVLGVGFIFLMLSSFLLKACCRLL